MRKANSLIDLVSNPQQAIDIIQKKWSPAKTGIIFILTFLMVAVNFMFVNFTGNVLGFVVYGVVFGIIMESMLLLLNLLFLYLFLRLTKWNGETKPFLKNTSWLIMIPALVYYLTTFPIFVVLRLALQEGSAVYLYGTAKYVMYIWIVCLQLVAVTKDRKDVRIKHVAAVILAFAVTYVFVLVVNYNLVSLIQSRVEV